MTLTPVRQAVLDRLRTGPLESDSFSEVCASKGVLKVHIHALRRDGFKIETTPIPGRGKASAYTLVE